MALDVTTLMLVACGLSLMTAGLLFHVRTGFPPDYRRLLLAWSQALLLQALAWVAFVALQAAPAPSGLPMVANGLMLLSLQRTNHAVRLFFGQPLRWRRDLALAVVAIAWLFVFEQVWPSISARVIGVSLALAIPMVDALLLFVRHARRPWPASHRVVVFFLAALTLTLALRAANQLWGDPVASLASEQPLQVLLYVLATLSPVATALGFALMVATRLQNELGDAAFTDPLTGLANRRRVEALARPWIDDPQARLSALMIDVDHFKKINDGFGHDAGDEALVWLGSHLRAQARASDLVGRLGGEEFVMLLPGTSVDAAAALAERLRATVAALPLDLGAQGRWPMTISIGVAERVVGDTDVRALLRRADDAMYEAKRAGRNRVAVAR